MIPLNIDQVDQGLSRNIDHRDKEKFNKLLEIFLLEIQELQDQTIEVSKQRDIDYAEGIWLDYIGKILGVSRGGITDEQYREALKLRVAINTSNGTPNEIISIIKKFTGLDFARIIEYPFAYFILVVQSANLLSSSIVGLLDRIKPAGAGTQIILNQNGTNFVPASYSDNTYTSFYNNEEYAKLAEVGVEDFEVVSPIGVTDTFILFNGQPLEIVSGNNAAITTKGIMAQVITEDTEAP